MIAGIVGGTWTNGTVQHDSTDLRRIPLPVPDLNPVRRNGAGTVVMAFLGVNVKRGRTPRHMRMRRYGPQATGLSQDRPRRTLGVAPFVLNRLLANHGSRPQNTP